MIFLTAEWRNLLMANYPVDPALLLPHLPAGTELDTFHGIHYLSLVGFLFKDTRVRGIAIPGHRTFEEVNLRFYVRYQEAGTWKRGVVFLKEIVPRQAIAWVANTLYGENYKYYPMRHSWTENEGRLKVRYEWEMAGKTNFLEATAAAAPALALPGSEEEFITEHYWGYTKRGEYETGSYEVRHPSWRVFPVSDFNFRCDVARLYGIGFAEALQRAPRSVFLAEGSPVEVLKGSRIKMALP
jgi:uncharacterized protein YqjF (DUF2071 family)